MDEVRMNKRSEVMKRKCVSSCLKKMTAGVLAASMLLGNNVAVLAEETAQKKAALNAATEADENKLKEAIRDSQELVDKYPDGIFNFLTTQMEIGEGDNYLEIAVIRQGGTAGTAKVRFKAIDVTASYGDDYKIYESRKKMKSGKGEMEKDKSSVPLIEAVMKDEVNISVDGNEGVDAEDAGAENIVSAAVLDNASGGSSGEVISDNAVAVSELKDATKADAVSAENDGRVSDDGTLRGRKQAQTGSTGSRPDWKMVTDNSVADEVRYNFDTFIDCVGGSETTLTFEDGEYVKYLYLVPEDDDVSESEEQVILGLLKDTAADAAPVGDYYNAYVNIKDNDSFEQSTYEFSKEKITADGKQVSVVIKRLTGTAQYDTIYVGTEAVTAAEGYDYKAGTKKVSFFAGQTEQKVTIDILNNSDRQVDKTFDIALSRDGETAFDSKCRVTIPASADADTEEVKLSAEALDTSAEKISPNGRSDRKGNWLITSADMTTWTSGNGRAAKPNSSDLRFSFTGRGTSGAKSDSIKLYGTSRLEYGYWNNGNGRSWTTDEYYYKNWWNKLWNKKTWYKQDHHEDNFNTKFMINGNTKAQTAGRSGWTAVGVKPGNNSEWNCSSFGFEAYAGGGNNTDANTNAIRLILKKYAVQCNNSTRFKTTEYTMDGMDKLKKKSESDITPVMVLSGIGSKVGNNVSSIGKDNYQEVYRSDALEFRFSNGIDNNIFTFDGIQASTDNKNWVKVSSGYTVVLNSSFFDKLNCFSTDKLYFKPVITHKDSTVKFTLDNKNKGTYTNLSENKSFTLKVGDKIYGIEGKSGAVSSYMPTFYVSVSGKASSSEVVKSISKWRIRKILTTYRSGFDSFSPAGSNGLELDSSNVAGAVANVRLVSTSEIIKLAYENPEVTVKADPSMYRNTYTNLNYVLDGKTYHTAVGSELEAFQEAMGENYKADTDKAVSVSFDYKYDTTFRNGKSSQQSEFGNVRSAVFTVYDSGNDVLSQKTLYPDANGHFTLSGTWKELKWLDDTYATIIFNGSRKVSGSYMTSLETVIDYTCNSASRVTVSDSNGNIMSDKSGNSVGTVGTDLVFAKLNPLDTYTMNSTSSAPFATRWADYSLDTDNDGSYDSISSAKERLKALGKDVDLIGALYVYYGNKFTYTPDTYAKSRVYYDFVRNLVVGGNTTVQLELRERYKTVLRPEIISERPLTGAQVTIGGVKQIEGDEDGYYTDEGPYIKGQNYLVDIRYQGVNFTSYVTGTGSNNAIIDTTQYMFPVNFSATVEDEAVSDLETTCLLKIQDKDVKFGFDFESSKSLRANKAVLRVYDGNYKNCIYTTTVSRDNTDTPFSASFNPLKVGAKAGYTMTIQGIYNDGSNDYVYPEVRCGFSFSEPLGVFTMASSFSSGFNKALKVIGKVATKFDLPINYDIEGNMNKSTYNIDNSPVTTYQIAFGYNNDVMSELKQQQYEYRAQNKGVAMSGRDNVKKYLEKLFDDIDSGDDGDDEGDDDKKDDGQQGKNEDNAEGASEKAGKAMAEDAPKKMDTSSSFGFNFSVAVILTLETGLKDESNGSYYESDGYTYFDSLAFVGAANAEAHFSAVYTTPIGVDIIGEMDATGKAAVGFGVESDNAKKYDDMFNLTKNKDEKSGDFKLDSDHFSMYTKFLVNPTITLGAGVGVGGGKISVTVSGTAAFEFAFTQPIMGNNYTSAGEGDVTLSVDLKLKILFFKKSWTLYKSNKMNLFEYGSQSIAEMMSDFEGNYLYDNIDDPVNTELISRDYLKNRSEWCPEMLSAQGVTDYTENVLLEGMNPDTETKLVNLNDGHYLLLFTYDDGERDIKNGSALAYSYYNNDSWSVPVIIDDDGTWDENPDAFVIGDRVLITWSDASREYTDEDDTKTLLNLSDISAAWFDIESGRMGDAFSITETVTEGDNKDMFCDSEPHIAYDEVTDRILLMFTRTDYDDKAYSSSVSDPASEVQDGGDITTYGDIINGYSVSAARFASYDESQGEYVWDTIVSKGSTVPDINYLDLGVSGEVKTVTEEAPEVVTVYDEQGNPSEEERVTEKLKTVYEVADQYDVNYVDPRVIESDMICYNQLAIYTYVMDCDADLATSDDRQVYAQIYNFDTELFYNPIQLTGEKGSYSNVEFARCKNMTYLFWNSNGDIVNANITDLVGSMDTENGILKKKVVSVPVWGKDESGNMVDTGSKDVSMYIVDQTGRQEGSFIQTAVKHNSVVAEDGTVTEDRIDDFQVIANDNAMYLLWTALNTKEADASKSGVDNVIHETQIYGAYCEPQYECQFMPYEFKDDEYVEYTFAEGKGRDTYPVSFKTLKERSEEGLSVSAGEVHVFDYSTEEDLNGYTGVVKAGDKAVRKLYTTCQGYEWSQPVQITDENGANINALSAALADDNTFMASYAKAEYKLNSDNVFEEKTDNEELVVASFGMTSDIVMGDIVLENDVNYPGRIANASVDVTNDGFAPIEGIQYKSYLENNGNIIEGTETEWKDLADSSSDTEQSGSERELTEEKKDTVEETPVYNNNVLIGGNTVTVQTGVKLPDEFDAVTYVVVIKDNNDKEIRVEKKIESTSDVSIAVTGTEIYSDGLAGISISAINNGNRDYEGSITAKAGGKDIAAAENVVVPYGESVNLELLADISDVDFGDVQTAQDGSKYDEMAVTLQAGDYSTDTVITRATSAESGKAYDSITDFGIGIKENIEDEVGTSPKIKEVGNKLDVSDDDYTIFTPVVKGSQDNADVNTRVLWESSDPSIGYVSEDGMFIPMKEGKVTVTAKLYPLTDTIGGVGSSVSGSEDAESGNASGGFGSIASYGTSGSFIRSPELYRIPDGLCKTASVDVEVKKAAVTPTPTPTPTATPTAAPTGTPGPDGTPAPVQSGSPEPTTPAQETAAPTADVTVAPTADVTAAPTMAVSPVPTDIDVKDDNASSKKQLKISSVKKVKPGSKKVVVKADAGKLKLKVYKNKALASKDKKKGLIAQYTVKLKKKGKYVFRLKKKLVKKQAVSIVLTKDGYKKRVKIVVVK